MPWTIPSTTGRSPEGFVLDPGALVGAAIDLGTRTGSLRLSSLTIPPAQKQPQWAANGDSDGSQLVRTPFYANRECTMQIRVTGINMDDAIGAIAALENKLQEADRMTGGLPVLWTPSGASTGRTLYMLLGQITDMPVTVDDGWFAGKPLLTVAFTCKPFLYAAEVTGATVTSSAPLLTLEAASVPGDVAAEARLVVTDQSTQVRRFVELGVEQRYYSHASPSSLFIDSASLVTVGFAGTALAHSGAYGGTTIATPLLSKPVALCGLGTQPHVGTFRVKGRIYAPSTKEYWRLSWKTGDEALQANDYAQPVVAGGFSEIDLGIVDVPPAPSGAQQWTGQIEAYTTTSGGETGELDDLKMYPCGEGYERIPATYSYQPGVVTGHDEFVGPAGTALNGRTASAGGSWATSGATTDFVYITGAAGVSRTTLSDSGPRYAILGSSSLAAVEVGVDLTVRAVGSLIGPLQSFLIFRWTDANNHARLVYDSLNGQFDIETAIAGVVTSVAPSGTHPTSTSIGSPLRKLRVVAFASGRVIGTLLDGTGATLFTVSGVSSALATGGVLASGKAGFADQNTFAQTVSRSYFNFYFGSPAAEPVTINSGRSLEVRSDSNLRQSADGTAYGDVIGRGSRLFIPTAGAGGRTTRIALSATRADLTTMADTSVADGDSIQATLHYTPRYLAVPR